METEWITTTRVLEDLETSNDCDTWNVFYRHFNPMLVNFGKHLGLSNNDAQDAAQKTLMEFVKAFRAGKYNRNRGRLKSWLSGIARNVILDFRKRLPREKLIRNETTGMSFWDLIEDENAIKHTWNTEWRRMILMNCLGQARREFSPKVFEAFELYALLDKSADEVAKQLDMSRTAVYISKSRVLSKVCELGNEFEKDG